MTDHGSTTVTIRVTDPTDEAANRLAWEITEAEAAERPYDDGTPWESFRAAVTVERSDVERTYLLAEIDGVAVGVGLFVTFTLDNLHLAELGIVTHPAHRRRGVGTALLADLEARAAASGRTSWSGGFQAPLDHDGPGHAFCAANGYDVVSGEGIKAIDLIASAPSWPPLRDDVAAHLGGYRIETFVDTMPEQWVDGFCRLMSFFHDEIPTGDLDLENAAWTPARLREHEERMATIGKSWLGAVAVAVDGEVAGFTELSLVRSHPVHAWNGGTLVDPAHRGHRLGLGMKLASHTLVRELYPACGTVLTGNADVNAPMNAVNETMGYRLVERWIDVQKRV